MFSKDGARRIDIRSHPIDTRGTKRPFKAIEAQVGGIVDMDCAKIPLGDKGGTFFSAPSPGAALVGICDPLCKSLLSVEVVSESINYEAWKRRISDYMSYPSNDILQIEDAWVCSSSGRWYVTMPGWRNWGTEGTTFQAYPKTRGANKSGFIKTKPLEGMDHIMSLTEFVLDRPNMPGSAMVIANAVLNWDDGKWERMETKFMDDSGVRELLKRVYTMKNGLVPMRLGPGSIGVVMSKSGTRAVFLPILPSEVQLTETSTMAIDHWVKSTMRDMWIEIVADIQTLSGVTAYKPSSRVMNTFGIFSLGVVSGGTTGAWKTGLIGYGLGATGTLLGSIKDQIVGVASSKAAFSLVDAFKKTFSVTK